MNFLGRILGLVQTGLIRDYALIFILGVAIIFRIDYLSKMNLPIITLITFSSCGGLCPAHFYSW